MGQSSVSVKSQRRCPVGYNKDNVFITHKTNPSNINPIPKHANINEIRKNILFFIKELKAESAMPIWKKVTAKAIL